MSKKNIPELTQAEFEEIWQDPMYVFDTSALCRFYTLTPDSKDRLIQLLDEIKDNTWIPARVKQEFMRHKDEELKKLFGEYQIPKFLKENHFDSELKGYIERKLQETHRHPLITERSIQEIKNLHNEYHKLSEKIRLAFQKAMNNGKEIVKAELNHDVIGNYVDSLATGNALPWSELIEIVKEGTVRYANSIPPGYKDQETKTSIDLYGDLIVWKEILREANDRQKNVIFITQDLKEDWSCADRADTIIPREELLTEFHDSTGKKIWMYTISDFIRKKAELAGILTSKDEAAKDNGNENNQDSSKEEKTLKSLLLELNLASISEDNIKAECPHCNRIIGISSDDIYWEWSSEASDEREMGEEICHQIDTEVDCPECGKSSELTITVYEYPIGFLNTITVDSSELTIYETPSMEEFIDEVPIGQMDVCVRCGEYRTDINDDGYCTDCMDEFERAISSDD